MSGVRLEARVHIVTGAAWLMVIPFTRLIHMLWFPFTRAYMGSEFGAVRHSRPSAMPSGRLSASPSPMSCSSRSV